MMKNYLKIEYVNSLKRKSIFEKNTLDIIFRNIRSNFLKFSLKKMSTKLILRAYFEDT